MRLEQFVKKIKTEINGKSLLICGLGGSGKTRLAKTLAKGVPNAFVMNDTFDQWDLPQLDISNFDRTTSEILLVIEDIDTMIDKRNWMSKSEKEMIERITQSISQSRHNKITIIALGRTSEIPGPIASISNAKIFCNCDGKAISYYYVNYPIVLSCRVKIHDILLESALIT